MSVVLRCPSCGTSQATPGNCDACHDGAVRPYCTNHTPGLWLDTSTCPKCGDEAGKREERPFAATTSRMPPRESSRPRSERPARASAASPEPLARTSGAVPERPVRPDAPLSERGFTTPPWQELVGALLRARGLSRSARARPAVATARGVGGCLVRMLLLAVLLFVGLLVLAVVLGRSILQELQLY